jgi:hypothetical protein
MPHKGFKFSKTSIEKMRKSHLGQKAWNKGTGGCKKGHDPALYIQVPSGVFVCFGCARENGAKYRAANRKKINLSNRAARYGMRSEEIVGLFQEQNGQCAICHCEIEFESSRIDHSHQTGKVRGILCTSCNTGIGLFGDSSETLTAAATYLKDADGI